MALDPKVAETVADLARLDLAGASGQEVDPERYKALFEEFSKIVGYMDILAEAQTEGVEPLYSPMIDPEPPRDDNPKTDSQKADELLSEAPEKVGRYFSVPRII